MMKPLNIDPFDTKSPTTKSPARTALVVICAVALLALVAPWLAPYPPNEHLPPPTAASSAPSWEHPFGTDIYSRDVLSRVLAGTRTSLGIAVLAVAVALVLGTLVGATAASLGGIGDAVLMRLTDAALAIPRILLLILTAAVIGTLSPLVFAVVIGATGWMTTARLVRQETLRLFATEHVRGARALGAGPGRIVMRHVLPSLAPTLAAAATVALAAAIPLEAALSYLGLGVPLPLASWGNIIQEAEGMILRRWWLVVFPVVAIVGSVFALNLIAERLSAASKREVL